MNAAKCLLKRHDMRIIADLCKTATRVRNPQNNRTPHVTSLRCACTECTLDRLKGCKDLNKCATEALNRINDLTQKFNLSTLGDPHDNLSLTKWRKARNELVKKDDKEILFDPSITCRTDIAKCFRVFTDPARICDIPAMCMYTMGLNLCHQKVTIYTDGVCFNNGKENTQCGSGIWFGNGDPRNKAI